MCVWVCRLHTYTWYKYTLYIHKHIQERERRRAHPLCSVVIGVVCAMWVLCELCVSCVWVVCEWCVGCAWVVRGLFWLAAWYGVWLVCDLRVTCVWVDCKQLCMSCVRVMCEVVRAFCVNYLWCFLRAVVSGRLILCVSWLVLCVSCVWLVRDLRVGCLRAVVYELCVRCAWVVCELSISSGE